MVSGQKSAFKKVDTIIFDADGVITTEDEYWLAAELSILEILYGSQWIGLRDDIYQIALHKPGRPVTIGRFVLRDFTERLKARGIVSNWDMAFFCCALYLLELLGKTEPAGRPETLTGEGFTAENISRLGEAVPNKSVALPTIEDIAGDFFEVADELRISLQQQGAPGSFPPLVAALNDRARKTCGIDEPIFSADDPLWHVCRTLFQEWYLGDDIFKANHGKKLSKIRKDGLIQFETPIIPLGGLIDVFSMLREANITLGIGTGRPRIEIITPLANWGLLNFFSWRRVSTNREIVRAERYIEESGLQTSLAKPHPYVFLKALFPNKSPAEILDTPLPLRDGGRVLVVGDTVADIAAAKTMGAQSAAVISSVKNLERAESIMALNPDYILEDVAAIKELF